MSVRPKNLNSPPNPAESLDLNTLIALVRRAFPLHLTVDVNGAAADGKFFGLYDAFSRKLLVAFCDLPAMRDYLDGISPASDESTVIPRKAGALDRSSIEYRAARWALHLKTRHAGLDCDKALIWADGDADRALARLIETKGYASTKV